jgi:hypothetical protein
MAQARHLYSEWSERYLDSCEAYGHWLIRPPFGCAGCWSGPLVCSLVAPAVIGGVAGVFVLFALEVKLLLCVPKKKKGKKSSGQ